MAKVASSSASTEVELWGEVVTITISLPDEDTAQAVFDGLSAQVSAGFIEIKFGGTKEQPQ